MNPDSKLQNERKRVTVLFADISGSTELVEKMDPEEVISDLLPTVDVMAQVVQQFGGTMVKTMGDGIMAIFGAPAALEHHAERACFHESARFWLVALHRRASCRERSFSFLRICARRWRA